MAAAALEVCCAALGCSLQPQQQHRCLRDAAAVRCSSPLLLPLLSLLLPLLLLPPPLLLLLPYCDRLAAVRSCCSTVGQKWGRGRGESAGFCSDTKRVQGEGALEHDCC